MLIINVWRFFFLLGQIKIILTCDINLNNWHPDVPDYISFYCGYIIFLLLFNISNYITTVTEKEKKKVKNRKKMEVLIFQIEKSNNFINPPLLETLS
jgi:hypothetical protein